ncbi:MAG TPA: DUF1508 domain-containing protein [Flavobacterium sp.]|nr:DUF1508 domain-containing protein [Flavobacterium sp.]
MGAFVISKRFNGEYKFVFSSRKGKVIFTSVSCKAKSVCEDMIREMKADISKFSFSRQKAVSGKYSFRLSKEGMVLANSRKYTTELRVQKGIDEIVKDVAFAEILDFSENDFVFPDSEVVFQEEE